MPQAGATDLRKTRGALGNVVITSTNAAAALELVMPEIGRIGFMADSVRIPTASVSLIILNVTFQSEALADGTVSVERDALNAIYREAAEGEAKGLLVLSEAGRVGRNAGRERRRGHRGCRDAHTHRLHGPEGPARRPGKPR